MSNTFARDESGHFALITALTLGVIMMVVGMAVDTAGMTSRKQLLQSAVDSAALSSAVTGEDLGEYKKVVAASIEANLQGHDVRTDVSTVDGNLRVAAETSYMPLMGGFFSRESGFGNKPVTVHAFAEIPLGGGQPLEIALALDTTTSMGELDATSGTTKLEVMQGAAVAMIDTLESRSGGNVRASVVPFSNYANVGTSALVKTSPWLVLDLPEGSVDDTKCVDKTLARPEQCGTKFIDAYDDLGNLAPIETQDCPASAYDVHAAPVCTTSTVTHKFNGCVGSREDEGGLRPEADALSPITGLTNVYCATKLVPMTDDLEFVRKRINGLSVSQKTYIPAGLIWAWRVLDSNAPFPNDSGVSDTKKAVVLMTDGMISLYKDINSANHRSANFDKEWDREQIDIGYARMDELCNRIKADGIQIFTIGFALDVADTRTRQALKSCASSPSNAYEPDDSVSLDAAFGKIGSSLSEIRLKR